MSPVAYPVVAGGAHPGWPAKLGPLPTVSGMVAGRPLHRRDFAEWQHARVRDEALIRRWDATSELTWEQRHSRAMWHAHRTLLRVGARRGEVVPFAITVDGAFAGQVTLGGIQRGALRSAWVGYWVDSRYHGKGVGTAAVALLVAHAFGPVGLHRVEATISPQNLASRAVVEHLGFRPEGELLRYLDIDGAWRDHLLFGLTVEELPGGLTQLLQRWRLSGSGSAPPAREPR
ncbi:GNAT family N-acetyltransferase [Nakamurella sp.]|uniref:GNAT family N-acetyltransferase n=1 Tax=Nakamurella sp. TaxID=1869182 RepID=UPI0037841ABC